MSVTLRYDLRVYADETPSLALDLVSNPVIRHQIGYSAVMSATLDAGTTVSVADVYSDTRQLSAGTYTLDLTSLLSTLSTVKVFTGQRVKFLTIAASASNTAGIVVKDGASNGYLIFATSTGETTIYPGCVLVCPFGNNLAAISSTVRNIDFSSSDLDAEFQILLAVGT